MAMPRFVNNFRPEEDEIIAECRDQGASVRHRTQQKPDNQQRAHCPGDPFYFQRQNKKDIDDFVRVKPREGVEERSQQHAVRKPTAEEKCRGGRTDHADKKIKHESKGTESALQAFANPPQEPEREKNPPRAKGLWNKNVGQ